MSLVQHVSAVEGVDREPLDRLFSPPADTDSLTSYPLGRRLSLTLSYDPIPNLHLLGPEPTFEKLDPLAAYEVSSRKRITQIVIGIISCVLASGIIFGFAALKSVLIGENVYRELCTDEELDKDVPVCYMQDLKLNFTFNIASVTCNVSALLVGAVLDRYGPRICGFTSSVLLLFGSLCMAFQAELPFDAIIVGHFLLGLGGTFVFVPSFHLSNTFPQLQDFILALVTGAFDASAADFLIFRIFYESSHGSFGLKPFFLAYLLVPVFIFVTQLTIMPTLSYETRTELIEKAEEAQNPAADLHDSDDELETEAERWRVRSIRHDERKQLRRDISDLLGPQRKRNHHEKREEEKRVASGVWGALHGMPAHEQIRTPWFILITLFTVLQMARFNWFITTVSSQYQYMLNSQNLGVRINEFFDLALPIGGLATVPFIGLTLDNVSTAVVLGLLVSMSTLIGVLGAIPLLWAAYANVVLFCLFRPLYYSAMSDYAAKVFGFATFGTVYGTIICLSGLCTFAQSALQAITHDLYHDDPTPVNLALASLGLLFGSMVVGWVTVGGKQVRKELADEDERRSLLPKPSLASLRDRAAMHGSFGNGGGEGPAAGGTSGRPSLGGRMLSTVQEGAEQAVESDEDSDYGDDRVQWRYGTFASRQRREDVRTSGESMRSSQGETVNGEAMAHSPKTQRRDQKEGGIDELLPKPNKHDDDDHGEEMDEQTPRRDV